MVIARVVSQPDPLPFVMLVIGSSHSCQIYVAQNVLLQSVWSSYLSLH